MEEEREQGSHVRRHMRMAGARLWRSRWTVGAAGVALFAMSGIAGGSPVVALVAVLAVVAVAAFVPDGARPADGVEAGPQPLGGGLTASDLAAAVGDPLIIFDARGLVAEANGAAQASFGPLPAGAALRLRFRAPEMQQFFDRYLDAPQPGVQTDYLERVPVERLYRVTAGPVGEATGLNVLMFRDQSEARRIDRMRADFVANASHELRTPLASIAGFIETLRGPARNDSAAREDFLQIMQDQTARMARLIDDLLSLSRLEMNASVDPNAVVDVKSVVESVIDSLGPLAMDSGVSILRELTAEKTLVVGNRDELFQVFENLLENACKYGQSGGKVAVIIEEGRGGSGRELLVTVRDFGPGIAEEHIPRITERFYRVDVETSRTQKGTGLGLSIVKHILTRHNAYLTISSELGKGAAFTVHFPSA